MLSRDNTVWKDQELVRQLLNISYNVFLLTDIYNQFLMRPGYSDKIEYAQSYEKVKIIGIKNKTRLIRRAQHNMVCLPVLN